MANLPSNISYGTVVGQFIASVGDSDDTGFDPDAVPMSGTITFTPTVSDMKNLGAQPNPVTIIKTAITGILDDEGYLCTDQIDPNTNRPKRGVTLVANDDEDLNPVDWVWKVTYRLRHGKFDVAGPKPHPINVPTNEVVDLTVVAPVSESAGAYIIRGPEGPPGPPGPAGSGGGEPVPGPQGPAGVARVFVETGSELRPDSDFIIWVGGSSRPLNMVEGDIWFSKSPSTPSVPVSITTTSINSLVVGSPFNQLLSATGSGPFTWSAVGLPAGLNLDQNTGSLSGTPTTAGTGSVAVTVESPSDSSSKVFTWTVVTAASAPVVLESPSPNAMVTGSVYSWTPGRTGSTPMTWGVSSGALPAGLAINTSTGAISGTPTTAGAYSFTLQATNSVGSNTRTFSGSVTAPEPKANISVFGSTNPGTLAYYDDAAPGSWIAHQFYVPSGSPSLISSPIIGARLLVPPGTSAVGQTWRIGLVRMTSANGGLVRVGGGDFGGQDLLSNNGAMTQGPALVAGWNELMFSQEWPGIAPGDGAIIGVMIGDGRHYLFNTTLSDSSVVSSINPSLVLAETQPTGPVRSFYRGSAASGAVRWYGIDILLKGS